MFIFIILSYLFLQYGSLQITLQVKTKAEVYICYHDDNGWKSDQLQRFGFVKKSEVVEGFYECSKIKYKMVIHQKNYLGKETVNLPETEWHLNVTIFVK